MPVVYGLDIQLTLKGLFTWREEDPGTSLGRSEKAENLFVCFTCRNCDPSGYQVDKEKKNNFRP